MDLRRVLPSVMIETKKNSRSPEATGVFQSREASKKSGQETAVVTAHRFSEQARGFQDGFAPKLFRRRNRISALPALQAVDALLLIRHGVS